MQEVIILNPVFKEMIWGGNRMRSVYGYDIPGEHTGECWAVSAHPAGDCTVNGGTYDGMHLSELWKNHQELFGYRKETAFPLLTKIIDAKEDLSVQVHPDNAYAYLHENGALGKTECWYVLDCDADAEIVIGHNAKDKEELRRMIYEGRFDDLIIKRKLHKGDFFQIDSGTVHAIKAGTMILETQQSSDVTYRLYDYNRLQNNKPRELHLEKSIDVIRCPHVSEEKQRVLQKLPGAVIETLTSCDYYTVKHATVFKRQEIALSDTFTICSVIAGSGTIGKLSVKAGMHMILPYGMKTVMTDGQMELILAHAN